MSDPVLTGGCGCGAVRFEIDEPLQAAAYCHCTRCQRRTGTAAAATALIEPGSMRVTAGEDVLRGWAPGSGMEKVFCSTCGSAVLTRDRDTGELRGVRLGAIDGDPGLRPALHQHVGTAAVWEPLPDDGLPRYEGARPSA